MGFLLTKALDDLVVEVMQASWLFMGDRNLCVLVSRFHGELGTHMTKGPRRLVVAVSWCQATQ